MRRRSNARSPLAVVAVVAVEVVLEHALQHLAWLLHDDPVVAKTLPAAWPPLLAPHEPKPFLGL